MADNNMTEQEALAFMDSMSSKLPPVRQAKSANPSGQMTEAEAIAFMDSMAPRLRGELKQQPPAQPTEEPSLTQEVLAGTARGLAPVARGAAAGSIIGGILGIPGGPPGIAAGALTGGEVGAFAGPLLETTYDLAVTGLNKLFGTNYQTASEMSADLMDKAGVPRTSTAAGRIAEGIAGGLSATKASIKAGATLANLPGSTNLVQRAAAFLSENPTQQYAAAVLAPFGGEGARQIAEASGASPEATQWAQLAGSFGGALAGGQVGRVRVTKEYNLPKIEGMDQKAVEQTIKAIEDTQGTIKGTVPTSMVFRPSGRIGQFFENVNEFVNAKGRVALSEDATKNISKMLADFGADNPESLAPKVAEAFSKSRWDKINELKGKLDPILERVDAKGTPVPVDRTIQSINDTIKNLESINPDLNKPAIDLLKQMRSGLIEEVIIPTSGQLPANYNSQRVIQRIPVANNPNISEIVIQGKPIKAIDGNLKLWGELVPSESTPLSALQKAKKAVYGPLKEDIGAHILAEEGPSAVKTWLRSNQELSDLAKEVRITAIKKAINTGEINPQLIDNVLFGQNETAYKTLQSNLDQEGKRVAQSRILQRIAEKSIDASTGEISNTRFLSNLNKNEKLISTYFTGDDKKLIDGTKNFLTLAAPAEKLKANPLNGSRLFLPQLGGVLAGVMTGPQGLIATAGLYGMAKLYDKPMTRELLMRLSRMKLEDPGSMVLVKRINQALVATAADRAVNDLDERKIQVAFNDRAVRKELIGRGMVLDDSVSGYRIISKDGKTARLMGPTGEMIGYFSSVDDARRRANKLTMMQLRKDTKKAYAP